MFDIATLKTSNYFSIKFISDTKDDKNKTLDKIIVTSRVNGISHSYTHDGDTNESEMVGIFKSSIRSAIANSGNMTTKHEFNNSKNGILFLPVMILIFVIISCYIFSYIFIYFQYPWS